MTINNINPPELLESMTSEQREDYEDILQEYPEIDTKWLAKKIANNQYHHYHDHNFQTYHRLFPDLPSSFSRPTLFKKVLISTRKSWLNLITSKSVIPFMIFMNATILLPLIS